MNRLILILRHAIVVYIIKLNHIIMKKNAFMVLKKLVSQRFLHHKITVSVIHKCNLKFLIINLKKNKIQTIQLSKYRIKRLIVSLFLHFSVSMILHVSREFHMLVLYVFKGKLTKSFKQYAKKK